MYQLVVAEVKRSAELQARVEERVKAGKCLHIEESASGKKCECSGSIHSLGYCVVHVNSYNYERDRLPTDAKKRLFSRSLELAGQKLRPGELRKLRRKFRSTHARVASEVNQ